MAGRTSIKKVKPVKQLVGEISIPGDKSISHRAILLNSIALGDSEVSNLATGNDCLSTVKCLKNLGVRFKRKSQEPYALIIYGRGHESLVEAQNVLDASNSGTTMRLLSGILAAQPFMSIINGDTSLRARPMKRLIDPLRLMGAEIYGRSNNSYAPLVIKGRELRGICYSLPVPSAQIKSAIMLAGLFASRDVTILQNQISRDHTELLLQLMGVRIKKDCSHVSLTPIKRPLKPVSLCVPGDISSASYWFVAGAIHPNAKIKVINCGINPTRTGIIDVLSEMGAKFVIENQRSQGNELVADITVESSELRGIQISRDLIPRLVDEIPILAVAACMAKGNTVIKDAGELRVKESDRIKTTVSELSRLGAHIEELPDGMIIYGGNPLIGAETKSHLDHRLAMSLAIAGLVARGETTIHDAQVVQISYPFFWRDLDKFTSGVCN